MMKYIILIFIFILFSFQFILTIPCPEVCVEENCSPPSNCYAGIVKVIIYRLANSYVILKYNKKLNILKYYCRINVIVVIYVGG